MLYEKKYLLVKDDLNNIFGYVLIENDNCVYVSYSLSVISFFIDIYVVFNGNVIKYFSNVLNKGKFKLNLEKYSNLAFIFVVDNKCLFTKNIDKSFLINFQKFYLCDNDNAIDIVLNRIFKTYKKQSCFEVIKNSLSELFENANLFCGFCNISNSHFVSVFTNRGEEVVGKIYNESNNISSIVIGCRVENIRCEPSKNLYQAKNGEWYLLNFYELA